MASVILSNVGAAVGSQGGPVGSFIGARVGQMIGQVIDNKIAGGGKTKVRGSRLNDLVIQTSTYGKMIPIVYGTVRVAGNMIWSLPIKEIATTTTSSSAAGGGKGGGGKVSQSSTSYSYFATMAIAVCEGEVDQIYRIWADAKQLDVSQYTMRIYKGSETQTPDSLIEATEGTGKTPAYRGLAYVVLEDFPLADFGNRIPNFTFEVKKKALYADYNGDTVENLIKGITLIPGAGEYVYDTQIQYKIPGIDVGGNWVQQGNQERINLHNPTGKANVLLALDQLKETCPNLEWVSVVVSWFGDSMDAGTCVVKPGVEYQTGGLTSPDEWGVAGFTRATARQITLVSGSPQFGGTPDDGSVVRLVDELRARGLKVALYPLLFMDVVGKPWRGELTGSASNVGNFFTKTNGYNAFVNHYATLLVGKLDAFIIGSELKGLTRVSASAGVYPAVSELISLAATVKTTLGGAVKITYAADWSEYHSTTGGWYNLDPLWASPNIDMIGIDAYFPLTDQQTTTYDIDQIKAGWTSGEGYSYYYTDVARTTQAALTAPYAWKNLSWFYNNTHINPNSVATAWTPAMKKIWFTEYGFPSVDNATNQPNVFYDPTTIGSAFPFFSKGRVDIRAQRAAIMATLAQWNASSMVEQLFLWTWDARPYPYWPDLTAIWNDGVAWKTGHWVQGKLGISNLSSILDDLCKRAGLAPTDYDVSKCAIPIEGYAISSQQSIREAIESLQLGFFFDVAESDYVLKFIPRGNNSIISIPENDLVMQNERDMNQSFNMVRAQEIELPKRVNVMYANRTANYQQATQYAQREVTFSKEINTVELPIVLSDQAAKNIADVTLFTSWVSRTNFQFTLPPRYLHLEPADVISVTSSGVTHLMRITSTRLVERGIAVNAVAEDVSAYDFYQAPGSGISGTIENNAPAATRLELLDIPALPGDDFTQSNIRLAATGLASGWTGAALYRSDDNGANYNRLIDVTSAGVVGSASSVLADGTNVVFDEVNTVTVVIQGEGELSSLTELAVLNGGNAAMLGSEMIQFKTATLISASTYLLSGLLRGRQGTEWAMGSHVAGERFVLLNANLSKLANTNGLINLPRIYKAVSFGSTLTDTAAQNFTFTAVALKPYAPVQISGVRDGANNLTINWVRRVRINGDLMDHVDVSLNEASELYEVDIMNGASVARTITGLTTPTVAYTAAQQITDFGSPQPSVSVRVYQFSGVVGRGYAGVSLPL